MSFESDKSDSCFTQGVRRRCLNRAISLFPAEQTPAMPCLVVVFSGWLFPVRRAANPSFRYKVGVVVVVVGGGGVRAGSNRRNVVRKPRVDIPVANPKDRPRSSCILFMSPVVSCIMPALCR